MRNDSAGQGHFGASRAGGKRSHRGADYEANPGGAVLSPVSGKVTKLGYPYKDDLSWRYVQVTDDSGSRHRMFYVDPSKGIKIGQTVQEYDQIGTAQNVAEKHGGGMKPHIHYEVIDRDGEYINPER